jgi:hypothetical protein
MNFNITNTSLIQTLNIEIPPYVKQEDIKQNKSAFKRFKKDDNLESSKFSKKLKANNIPFSFNRRFILPKNRYLYFRTIKQNTYDDVSYTHDIEHLYFSYLDTNMPNIEQHEIYKRSLNGFSTNLVSMSNRIFSYTRAFITHCVKNTFVTLFRGNVRDTFYMKVLAKVSAGLIGYKGPKKSTVFARKSVIKEAGKLLANNMTTMLDVVFTSKVSRWNRKSVRDLCPNLSYILNIHITYSRPHGYKKEVTRRRV